MVNRWSAASKLNFAPSFWNPRKCVSSRRRPILSPPGFGMVALTLKDGRTLSGTLKEETPGSNGTLTLLLPDGKTGSVQLSDIATRTPAISAMPPMNGILTKRQLRDVVEFLANQD